MNIFLYYYLLIIVLFSIQITVNLLLPTPVCRRSVQKVSIHVLWKIEAFIEKDIRNTVCCTVMPQAPSKLAPWDLTQFSQSPSAIPSYFPESHQWYEISSLSKVILVLGKARSHKAPNLAYIWAESPGCFDVLPKTSARDCAQ